MEFVNHLWFSFLALSVLRIASLGRVQRCAVAAKKVRKSTLMRSTITKDGSLQTSLGQKGVNHFQRFISVPFLVVVGPGPDSCTAARFLLFSEKENGSRSKKKSFHFLNQSRMRQAHPITVILGHFCSNRLNLFFSTTRTHHNITCYYFQNLLRGLLCSLFCCNIDGFFS